jgi:hypothetical protein
LRFFATFRLNATSRIRLLSATRLLDLPCVTGGLVLPPLLLCFPPLLGLERSALRLLCAPSFIGLAGKPLPLD